MGEELKPSSFGITPGKSNELNPVSKPDKFGQVWSAERDATKGDSPSPLESNRAHINSDVDSSLKSLHHTLGMRRNQASPGNHIHDGVTSPKLGGRSMAPGGGSTVPALTLTGSKGGNVALANLITMLKNFVDFTDTTT